jgi:peptidoglycan hydrolase-like protein with peptidoglycan-binding domain
MLQKRIFTGLIAVAMVFAMVATATAQTTVMQQTTTVSTSYTFNMNLTIGSTGADVVALQSILVGKGFLTMPVGVSMGYFGPLTRSALAAFQASVGISPAVGYFGPITRAYFNTHNMTSTSTTTTTTVPGCAPGAMFSSTTGARCDSTPSSSGSGSSGA